MRTLTMLVLMLWLGLAWALEPDPMDPRGDPRHLPEEDLTDAEKAQLGYMLFDQEEYEDAYRHLEPLAEAGHAKPQFYMGYMHAKGLHVDQDADAAIRWYKAAADQGDVPAQYNIGVMYAHGEGIARDEAEGARWIREAAEAGYDRAQYSLGLMYTNGHGVEEDHAEAMRWFQSAADKGFRHAQYSVALNYLQGQGVEADEEEGFRWASKAAERRVPDAQALLGALYASGRGVERDEAEAAQWYAKSVENGSEVGASRFEEFLAERQRRVADDGVTFHEDASESADVVAERNDGDVVAVIQERRSWVQCYLTDIGVFAWVQANALTPEEQ